PDLSLMAFPIGEKGTTVWDTRTGACLWCEERFAGLSVAFTPDGKGLLSAGLGRTSIDLWDARAGNHLRMLQHSDFAFWHIAGIDPTQKYAAILIGQHMPGFQLRIWDLASGR